MKLRSFIVAIVAAFSCTVSTAQQVEKKSVSLEDIWQKGTFQSKGIPGLQMMHDGMSYTTLFSSDKGKQFILKHAITTGKVIDTLVRVSELQLNGKAIKLQDYRFSSNEKKILIETDNEPIYRHSYLSNNLVYDLVTKTLTAVNTKEKQKYAAFSPNGEALAYVRSNNLYIKNLFSNVETQVTFDGAPNKIINGGTDWVYEEEFSFDRAFAWSPDNQRIAYYRFDESAVKEYHMPIYNDLYPEDYTYKYPKAGEDNSKVSIHVFNITDKVTTDMSIGTDSTQYIPRIQWTRNSTMLCILRLNRRQNQLDYLMADATSGKCKTALSERSDTYIDITDDLFFTKDGRSFILTSEHEGYRRIYKYALDGSLQARITTGNFDVTRLYGVDENAQRVYFQSSEGSPLRRNIYSVDYMGNNKKQLTVKEGTNNAVFTPTFSYFINTHSDANTPAFISLNDRSGKEIRVLETNEALKNKLKEYSLSKKEFLPIDNAEGQILNAWIIKPANFDPSKKYPVLMYVYGGPGSQTVTDSWGGANDFWYQMLASKGYIVVSVDGRGTGNRGSRFKTCTYLNLGGLELEDQAAAAQWLTKQSYVDGSRIGIWGWSFGGYMSSLCITKYANLFKMAVAVAPVTNWKFYDSIYTERFLRTPQENKKGYEDNSPVNFVDRLKGPYLLIHGTADDNVHYQNATEMVKALIKANKQFDSAYYPDKNHSIYGGNTRLHLYTKMTNFILANL